MTVKSPHLQDESSKLETQESQRERGPVLRTKAQEPEESTAEFQTEKQAQDLERGNISVWVWRQEKNWYPTLKSVRQEFSLSWEGVNLVILFK